jgi:hypothetical protein
VVGDEPLVATDDPGQVTDAGGLAGIERERYGEPGRVAECLRPGRPQLQLLGARQVLANPLCLRKVEAEQIAGIGISGDVGILQTFV